MADKSTLAAIARANGARSRGPVTPEGKARSSMNAVTHGLSSRNVVLDHESRAAFDALVADFVRAVEPVGPLETALVHDLAAARWRLCRAWGMESAAIDLEVAAQAAQAAPATLTALAFRNLAVRPGAFGLLSRYEARHRRSFDRTLQNLVFAQQSRKSAKVPVSQKEPR
jgi:hypothetical protein